MVTNPWRIFNVNVNNSEGGLDVLRKQAPNNASMSNKPPPKAPIFTPILFNLNRKMPPNSKQIPADVSKIPRVT